MKKNIFVLAILIGLALFAEPVAFRGVVEGYYGRPWGTEGRLSLLDFMGKNGMNVFIYGPKDDPYHHRKWREGYPANEIADFRRLLVSANRNGVNFYWAIHLGDGYQRGNDSDRAALFAKLEHMYAIGFRSFAIFFDDFGSDDAEFHAEVCNDVKKNFIEQKGGCSPLIMCPHVYWGSGHPYQRKLGEKLHPDIKIMWTGRGICSDIDADEVKKITADFRRPPFIWWNWPVNDFCRRSVLLGRTYGLDACEFSGFVSNPMENCEASKIALYGIAKWCKDPEHFDSQKTWEETFPALYRDPEIAAAMRIFAEHNSDPGPNGHGYRREESVAVRDLFARASRQLESDGRLGAAEKVAISDVFKRLKSASETLLAKLPHHRGLGWELKGWLESEVHLCAQALAALEQEDDVLVSTLSKVREAAERDGEASRERFRAATFADDRNWIPVPVASGSILRPFVEKLLITRLGQISQKRFGHVRSGSVGLEGFSTAASLPKLIASRDGKFAKLDRVLELKTIAPGETFGISVPAEWDTDYFHAKLSNVEASEKGVIEVSKDGKIWNKLAVRVHDGEMETRLDVSEKWRYARYRNASDESVSLKIEQFKFDVRGEFSPIDALLKTLR